MEHKAVGKPSTVSRLPKFGSRPVKNPGSLPNGTVHSRLPHEARSTSGKFSGVVHLSSCPKTYGSSGTAPIQEVPGEKRENWVFQSPGSRVNKKPNTSPKTGHRSASTGTPKPAPESLRSTVNIKTGSTSPCDSAFKLTHNGTADSIGGGPRLQKSGDNISSSNTIRHSVLGTPSSDRMVRSQSFSHFRQRPPAPSAIPRSFSFNKAVELAKPLPNTQLCPVRTLGLKSPQCISSSTLGVGFGKTFTNHLSAVAPLSGCSTPPSGLKKPSLSRTVLSKPSSLGYGLSHVFTAKPQHPLVGGRNPEITLPGLSQDGEQFGKSSPADIPDGSEEMSVSSASSDRNDTCEDLLDDFDHLGGAVSVSSLELSPSSSGGTYIWDEEMMEPLGHNTHTQTHTDTHNTHTQTHTDTDNTHSYTQTHTDTHNTHTQTHTDTHNTHTQTHTDTDNTHSYTQTHTDTHNTHGHTHNTNSYHCSYKSILSRMDGEKNQEALDLQKDKILTMDHPQSRASHTEEPQQRNSRENHLQNHNWLLLLEGFEGPSAVQSGGHMVALEECTVQQMLQDCYLVKAQLLQLQLLLQMEDSEMNSKEWSEVNNAPCCQKKKLQREGTSLREDLNKDKIITQLTQQLQQQKHQGRLLSGSGGVKWVKGQKADKFTQTPWRPAHLLQKLHHSSPQPQESSATSGTFNKLSHYRGPQ